MKQGKFDIYVFADWKGMAAPKLMGILSAHYGKGKKAFGFEYDKDWIKTASQRLIDPDIQFFSGAQFPNNKENFGVFLDCHVLKKVYTFYINTKIRLQFKYNPKIDLQSPFFCNNFSIYNLPF